MDHLARMSGDLAHVTISGLDAVGMNNRDLPSIASVPPGTTTRPSAAATIGVPTDAARSTPLMEANIAEDRVKTLRQSRRHPSVDRQLDALRILAADAITIDPDDRLAVRPFEKFDIGARDAVHADVDKPAPAPSGKCSMMGRTCRQR